MSTYSAHLFVRGVDPKSWALSAGPSIVNVLGGRMEDRIYVPGVLLSFPNVRSAARAALRLNQEYSRTTDRALIPPMAIDSGTDPAFLPAVTFDTQAGSVVVTQDAERFLASEPVEMLPGPMVPREGKGDLPTRLLPASSHNLGWALPSLDTGKPDHRYLRAEPAVVNIQMEPRRRPRLPFFIPFKLIFLMAFAGVALLFAYVMVQALHPPKTGEESTAEEPATSTVTTQEPASEARAREAREVPVLKATEIPIPPGFGAVVIQTEPPDAKIYVNEELVGSKSPVKLEKQSNQEAYKLTVTRKGYDPYMKIYNVEADQRMVIHVRLERAGTAKKK
jgi:hypothetical protein